MTDYTLHKTDIDSPIIVVPELDTNDSSVDVTLFGRINLEYGEELNEDLLNLLENFACPESSESTNIFDAVPDLTQTSKTQLSKPIEGQFWYNSDRKMIYYWHESVWTPIPLRENYAANWGNVIHGQQLPRPVSPITGHIFDYSDCIWSVAPMVYVGKFGFMSCATDEDAVVTMQYRLSGTNDVISGIVNYLIIGIRGNYNTGQYLPPILISPTPSPTPDPSVTPSVTPSPTPAPSGTPPVTPTPTPAPSVTPTISVTPTVTPTVSVTVSITPTISVTPTITLSISVTPTITPVASETPTPTPTPTPSSIIMSCMCEGAYFNGIGYKTSYANFTTFAECELNKPSESYECVSNGGDCWQLIRDSDPNLDECPSI